jgi:plastocyanin
MRKLMNRRNLVASAGVGAATVVFGRTVVGKDDDKKDHDDDDSSHGGDDDADVPPAGTVPAGSAEVRIVDDDADGFEPGTITINLGESVTWVNVDKDPHTATGSTFDTGRIEPGEQSTITFDTAGSFPYFCQIHPVMTGTVEVRDENGNVPASPQASPAASPQASPASGQKAVVKILNFDFDPNELLISVGTTVEWTNQDEAPHTATATDDSFDSGILETGGTFSHTFDTAGTFDYFCELHPNMKAQVIVGG